MTRNNRPNSGTHAARTVPGNGFIVFLVAAQAQSLALATDLAHTYEKGPQSALRNIDEETSR
ncbi:hypothetical protein SAMN04487965_1400 [Microbulbifer donghaiensis]|uniref:Uncharacterized protein n=1 Tax=Microbulbifer donghaiensis TaxID=494016 RepID=A0A1M4Z092_9GAMM|nr:hypothetical protein [Microbulbifer donghaiensis]SHF11400.1 hypothetical protein SAMN04487965_1400 [Microbulbifer donghaiensis]